MSSQVDLQQLEQRCVSAIEAKISALGEQLRALLVQGNGHIGNAATENGDDAQKSHDKLIHQQALATLDANYARQIDALKESIAEERAENAKAQSIFEDTLRAKYEQMVTALQDRVKAEQQQQMARALDALERTARAEADRHRYAYEAQMAAEAAATAKFQEMVVQLRQTWEEEEAARAKHVEERLRAHYNSVMSHMEAQLAMALRLQDEADAQWMADVEARNKQQITALTMYEEKCRRLYDTRLKEYVEKTDEQISKYEEKLVQAGVSFASERNRYESKLRRLKIACGKWRVDYQKDMHARYQASLAALEVRYTEELSKLLQELSEARDEMAKVEALVQEKERYLLEERAKFERMEFAEKERAARRPKLSQFKATLEKLWQALKSSPEERIAVLSELLDHADYTPELAEKYEQVQAKLSARLPILQLLTRKQFLEFRLKNMQDGPDNASSAHEKEAVVNELAQIQMEVESAIQAYEARYRERFQRTTAVPVAAHPRPAMAKKIPRSPS